MYRVFEFWDLGRDSVWLLTPRELKLADLLLDNLSQNGRQQLLVIACLGEVFAEALLLST